ncbi:hypothetical protein NC653_024613 [Populus alba x Populus x berolinensis]|uniref:Uncharacterized protein n=1 Tax=Populus alba x Populus x berolinensis TaxID=444605 RepID=A0AAD6Q8W2_9ROSI|nr:hypothetical protein NC653_024613 [Populus alba x Populus x berolinensis]
MMAELGIVPWNVVCAFAGLKMKRR